MSAIAGPLKINLAHERLSAGYSLRSLGRRLGMHPSTIKRAEAGEPIHPAHARQLADFHGHAVTEIWDLEHAT